MEGIILYIFINVSTFLKKSRWNNVGVKAHKIGTQEVSGVFQFSIKTSKVFFSVLWANLTGM